MKSKNSKELTEKLAIKLTDILDELKQDIVNNKLESYENLL